jgi:hypothetical protein
MVSAGLTVGIRTDVGLGNTGPCPTASKVAELIEPELP